MAPRRLGSKYSPLREHLHKQGKFRSLTTLSFAKIEGIIKDGLPFTALRSEKWWNNNEKTPQGYAWTSVGWTVQRVNLTERTVSLKKDAASVVTAVKKRTRKAKKTFKPPPVRPRKPRRPSKTKIAKTIARARNIERRRATRGYQGFRGKLKPRSAYEKRLFKPTSKPNAQE